MAFLDQFLIEFLLNLIRWLASQLAGVIAVWLHRLGVGLAGRARTAGLPSVLHPVNNAVQGGSGAVTDRGAGRATHHDAFCATHHRTTDGSDARRYDRSAGTTSEAAGSTADDRAHDAPNNAGGHAPRIRLRCSRGGGLGNRLGRGVGQRFLPGSL
jgi:hypothetical protein